MSLFEKLKSEAKKLKSESRVLMAAYADKRTPVLAKILIGVTVAYLFSPVDLIPDFIPVLGLLDDLFIVPALISLSFKLIPDTVLRDARERVNGSWQLRKRGRYIAVIVIILIWIVAGYFVFSGLKGFLEK